jgi:serine kinase of HPr protein (carbohydrate metabolism regulator)
VASLLELPAVIITEGARPDQDTLTRANQQGITLLSTPLGSFEVIGRLWEMGLRGQ